MPLDGDSFRCEQEMWIHRAFYLPIQVGGDDPLTLLPAPWYRVLDPAQNLPETSWMGIKDPSLMVQDPSLMVACGKEERVLCWRAGSEAGLVLDVLCIAHAVVKSSSLNSYHALWWGNEASGSLSGC